MATVSRAAASAFAALALIAKLGCSDGEHSTLGPTSATIGGFTLQPLPAAERRECEQHAALAEGVSCPVSFPRPSDGHDGDWFVKPVRQRLGRNAPRRGIDISFVPEADSEIVHFSLSTAPRRSGLVGYGEELPASSRRQEFGDRSGIYAPATGPAPCCNHAVFVWREAGRAYAASLHAIGPDTKPLLGAIVERLELPPTAG